MPGARGLIGQAGAVPAAFPGCRARANVVRHFHEPFSHCTVDMAQVLDPADPAASSLCLSVTVLCELIGNEGAEVGAHGPCKRRQSRISFPCGLVGWDGSD